MNEDEGIHPERNRSSYERSIVRSGEQQGSIRSGDEDERDENERETYWVRTGLELAGVVSERVLTNGGIISSEVGTVESSVPREQSTSGCRDEW